MTVPPNSNIFQNHSSTYGSKYHFKFCLVLKTNQIILQNYYSWNTVKLIRALKFPLDLNRTLYLSLI